MHYSLEQWWRRSRIFSFHRKFAKAIARERPSAFACFANWMYGHVRHEELQSDKNRLSKVFWIMWWKMLHIVSHSSEIWDAKDTATCLAVVFTTFRKNHWVIDGVLSALPSWMFMFGRCKEKNHKSFVGKACWPLVKTEKSLG